MVVKVIKGGTLKAGIAAKTAGRKKSLAQTTKVTAAASSNSFDADQLAKLTISERDVATLTPAKRRVRKASARQVEALLRSIQRHGFFGPILTAGSKIVDGHARVEALKLLGVETVSVIDVSHLSDATVESLMIAVNRIGETGDWDLEELRLSLVELSLEGLDSLAIGFDPAEIDALLLDPLADGPGELDAIPEPSAGPPIAKPGDVWRLGKHRLICGSALDAATYGALMGEEHATVIFTDPPYNVKIQGNVSGLGKVKHGEFAMASGEQTEEQFKEFLTSCLTLSSARLIDRGVVFAFMDWRSASVLESAGKTTGLRHINTAVWAKGNGGMGALYRSAHELVLVFCKGDSPLINNVNLGAKGRDRTNVWQYPGANQPGSSANKALKDHPTPKCVELVVDALIDVSEPGDAVLDPFMGSGTTIIAAEECGRIAYGVELEPKFVDCTIRRWEAMLAGDAILADTGETFAEVTARRTADA